MADTSGPGSYTTPPNANFKGQIQTPNRTHSSLRAAVCIPQDTRSPLGDAIRKLSVLIPRKPPRACSPSPCTALTGVTEPSTRTPLRPRSGAPPPFRPGLRYLPGSSACHRPGDPTAFCAAALRPSNPVSGRAAHLLRPPTLPARRLRPHPRAPRDSGPGSPPPHCCSPLPA